MRATSVDGKSETSLKRMKKQRTASFRFIVKNSSLPVRATQINTVFDNKIVASAPKYENIFVLAYILHMPVLVQCNSVWQQIINPDSYTQAQMKEGGLKTCNSHNNPPVR